MISSLTFSLCFYFFLSCLICCFYGWALTWSSGACSMGCAAQSDRARSTTCQLMPTFWVFSDQGKTFLLLWDSFSCLSNAWVRSPEHHLHWVCFMGKEKRSESRSPSLYGAPIPSSGKATGIFRQKTISLLTYLLSSSSTKICTSSLTDSAVLLNDIVKSRL